MLFLMNDVVFSLDGVVRNAQMGGTQVKKLSMPAIIRMGQELYAGAPLLQHTHPDQALRLSALISAKAPMINAALFVAPTYGCKADEVTVRFVSAQFEVMADLYNMYRDGRLSAVKVDRIIWQRLAA
jgi:hypothetical protein